MNDSWITDLLQFVTGIGGLILFIFSVILAIYWPDSERGTDEVAAEHLGAGTAAQRGLHPARPERHA